MNRAQAQFVQWVKQNEPFLYRIAANIHALKTGGQVGAWTDIFSSVADTVKNVAPAVLQFQSQKKILDAQLERAKAGLPPMDVASYTPTVKVAADVTPEMEASAKRIAIDTVKQGISDLKPLMIGGMLAVGAFLIWNSRK